MGMNYKEYVIQLDTGLKTNKEYDKFYINFTNNGKRFRKQFDYSDKYWDKKTRVTKAKIELLEMKEKINNSSININSNSKLDQIAEMYFQQREKTKWTEEMISIYNVHIKDFLGNKKISLIKRVDVDNLKSRLQSKGGNKQTENGCSPRTIQKILKNVLKPVMQYAYDNEIIDRIPKIETPTVNNKPKLIENPANTFLVLYNTILELYKDDPFYRSLYLFIVFGRRQNEVLSLNWEDVNFSKKIYIIRKEFNKIGQDQIYDLPNILEKSLKELGGGKDLIFKSPITGKKLKDIRCQTNKIRDMAGLNQLTIHMFRNVIASFLASRPEVSPTMIAAALGHVDLQTASKHYISKDHTGASKNINSILIKEIDDFKFET